MKELGNPSSLLLSTVKKVYIKLGWENFVPQILCLHLFVVTPELNNGLVYVCMYSYLCSYGDIAIYFNDLLDSLLPR